MLGVIHTTLSLALAAFAGWAVMSRCVNDGIMIKIGLVLISIGFLGAAFLGPDPADARSMVISHTLVSLGLLICVAGYLLRTRKRNARIKRRRVSDWVETSQ